MALGISRYLTSTLARGAAILVLGGLAAGCSSGASSLTDGLVTGSVQPVAQGGDRVPRPQMPVGGGVMQSAAPVAASSTPVYSPAPVYTAPSGSVVSSSSLPPPQGAQSSGSALAPVAVEPQRNNVAQPTAVAAVPPAATQSPRPAETAPAAAGITSYTVASGDTLYGIARQTGANVDSIRRANGLSGDSIRVGQRLNIPSGSGTSHTQMASVAPTSPSETPRAADTSTTTVVSTPPPSAPASSTAPTASAAAPQAQSAPQAPSVGTYTPPARNDDVAEEAGSTEMAALTPDATGVGRLRWPVRGRVVAGFGADSGGRSNDGIDIAVPAGTSIRAAENGVVIYAGDGLKGFGNTVLVRHEDGLVTVYGHASELKVKRGDNVRRGQEIALSGMTGDADRPKLHFEVRQGTNPVDPMTYLE